MADLAERAARLAKADLVTGMVGEFPELQGVMGGYYAAAQGEDPRVAEAIRDHYKPVGQGDDVPTAPVTVAVSLADKLDSLLSFWSVGERPTGSRDPYALRRAALSALSLITRNELRFAITALPRHFDAQSSRQLIRDYYDFTSVAVSEGRMKAEAVKAIDINGTDEDVLNAVESFWGVPGGIAEPVRAFLADRLKVQQREAGVRHDLIDAVFALGGEDDLVRLLARVRALQAFVGTEDGANLLTSYRRAANILKKEGYASPLPPGEGQDESAPRGEGEPRRDPHPSAASPLPPSPDGRGISLSYTPEPAEEALHAALDSAEPTAADAVAREELGGAMAALASLRAPIDRFFDEVTVNDADPARRAARLALLARMRDAVHTVADFSRIEG